MDSSIEHTMVSSRNAYTIDVDSAFKETTTTTKRYCPMCCQTLYRSLSVARRQCICHFASPSLYQLSDNSIYYTLKIQKKNPHLPFCIVCTTKFASINNNHHTTTKRQTRLIVTTI